MVIAEIPIGILSLVNGEKPEDAADRGKEECPPDDGEGSGRPPRQPCRRAVKPGFFDFQWLQHSKRSFYGRRSALRSESRSRASLNEEPPCAAAGEAASREVDFCLGCARGQQSANGLDQGEGDSRRAVAAQPLVDGVPLKRLREGAKGRDGEFRGIDRQ